MTLTADRRMFRELKPGYHEVMELVNSLNPSFPSISEIELALSELYECHKVAYREEIEAQDLDFEEEKRNDPWKGIYAYQWAEYRNAEGRLVPEANARKEGAAIWVYTESDWTIMSSDTKQSASIRDPNDKNYRYYDIQHPVTGKWCKPSSRGWKGTRYVDPEHPDRNSCESLLADDRLSFGPDENKVPRQKRFLKDVETNVCKSVFADYADGEKELVNLFDRSGLFLAPKHTQFVSRFIEQAVYQSGIVLDCFGGSGSTAHAVLKINRAENWRLKYLTAEMGLHFDTLIVNRLKKIVYAPEWIKGKPKTRNSGISHCFKYLRLESYEDTLNNLRFTANPARELALAGNDSLRRDYTLNYLLDVETRGSQCLLNIEAFTDPTAYTLKVKKPGATASVEAKVDLIETFNFLIGLRLDHLDAPQRFAASFKRVPDADLPAGTDTRLQLDGRMTQSKDGPWWFRKVEGWVPKDRENPNNGQKEKILIVWRTLTGNLEEDNLMLDEWFQKNRLRTRDFEFNTIYVNGSNNLPNLKLDTDTWKVRLIEEEFSKAMWDVQDG